MPDPNNLYQDRWWDGEHWVPVPLSGFPYWVSNRGNVFSEHTEQILDPYTDQSGRYLIVDLRDGDGTRKQRSVHTLVMEAFRGDAPQSHVVAHEDDNPKNNRLDNLRYVRAEENREQAAEDDTADSSIEVKDAPF